MPPSQIALLFSAAVLGGAINSVAGGGGFIVFPALLFTGMPPVNANATNTVALWPGTLASSWAYRKALNRELFRSLLPLMVITVCGSILGAALLLRTPQTTFLKMVPWLLLGATLLFIFGGKITSWMRQRHPVQPPSRTTIIAVTFVQLCVAVYIGYYGAGVGFVILALLTIMGIENIHAMNGMKTVLATCGNVVAIVMFIFAHAVIWPQSLLIDRRGSLRWLRRRSLCTEIGPEDRAIHRDRYRIRHDSLFLLADKETLNASPLGLKNCDCPHKPPFRAEDVAARITKSGH
ncbi:MAG TPA: sulfite exporter TauE/SafE family protein [Candidatus Angelobacter sp.]|nr:sulfite exporter TauE/SafE family protein [Candidatus Angelobacter sp.]